MSDDSIAFGNSATTAIFAVIVSFAVLILVGLAFFSYKYTFRSMFGVYDPVFRANTRYSYMFDTDLPARVVQPYIHYNGINYFMFGNDEFTYRHNRRNRARKVDLLTEEQLNDMFPLKTYQKWLSNGKESSRNGKVGYKEEFENIEGEGEQRTSENIQESDLNIGEISYTVGESIEMENPSSKIDSEKKPEVIEEQDITDMTPTNKTEYIVTTVSHDSNEIKAENDGKHFSSGTCTICLETFEDEDEVRGLICGHVFHQSCIDPWLTTRSACCPICKKDLYIEVNNANNQEEEPTANPNPVRGALFGLTFDDMVRLPGEDDAPGTQELDSFFKLDPFNNFSFFLIMFITKLEAQLLLTALMYIRNNNYSSDNISTSEVEEIEDPQLYQIPDEERENLSALFYADLIASKFKQQNDTESFDRPPIPDMNNLNPYIKKIVEHNPRPFNASDLGDLDYEAWKETKKNCHGLKKIYFSLIGISRLQIYYHNVIKIYNSRRQERLNL